jgi:F0F1-type ATP synthase membrane subunit c/vacuolar-type H+-ATPase subunit K
MRKLFEIGGLVAAVVLIAFGVGAIAMSVDGRSTVRDSLKLEQIVGSPDMTPAAIAAEAKQAGLTGVDLPTESVAGKEINTGARAKAFASYMRIHALEATGGLTYSQMGRFVAKPGTPAKFTDGRGGTSDTKYAVVDPKSQRPVDNAARNLWVTETALSTALNVSYMAEQVALFGLVVGIALLLAGIGFAVLAVGGALRNPETALTLFRRKSARVTTAPTA